MRRYLASVAVALMSAGAHAAELPAAVKAAVADSQSWCSTKPVLQKGFVTTRDINGDGRPDYILDYQSFYCDGSRGFCGTLGCWVQIFVSSPDGRYRKALDETVRRFSLRQVSGRLAVVLGIAGDSDSCKRDPGDVCDVIRVWNGSAFVEGR